MKLAIITTHPIQYNAPLFKLLADRGNIQVKVFYTWSQSAESVYDPDFGHTRSWDIPLLEGYEYEFIENISEAPGSDHFKGIINPTLNSKIEEWGADSILVFGWKFSSHLKALRYFKGKKKLIFRGDSTLMDDAPGFSIKKMMRRTLLTWVYSHIDIALYAGTKNKDYFLKHGVKPNELFLAPHCIDNNRFANNDSNFEAEARKWKKEIGIDSKPVILFVGKFLPKKNPFLLIDSAGLFENKFNYLFVGNGELEDEMKQKAEKLTNVYFLPFQNQSKMPVIYRMGDIYCLPSSGPGETWGLAVNEAMACSRPVIVSDKCGCAVDLVTDKTGFIFESGNSKSLRGCLDAYSLMDEGNIKVMGTAAKSKIQEFSYEKQATALEKAVNA